MDLAGLECVCNGASLCLLLQISIITIISAVYCGFLGPFLRKKQIALQQDPFRSSSDSMTLSDSIGIYLFVIPSTIWEQGPDHSEKQQQKIFSQNSVSNFDYLNLNWLIWSESSCNCFVASWILRVFHKTLMSRVWPDFAPCFLQYHRNLKCAWLALAQLEKGSASMRVLEVLQAQLTSNMNSTLTTLLEGCVFDKPWMNKSTRCFDSCSSLFFFMSAITHHRCISLAHPFLYTLAQYSLHSWAEQRPNSRCWGQGVCLAASFLFWCWTPLGLKVFKP